MGTRNYIILLLKSQQALNFSWSVPVLPNQKKYRMKQSWRQASMQVLNSSVARPWKKEHNTSGQASRQASRASRPWKLEQNNMTQKVPFFGPQNVRKSRRAKMGLPSSRFQPPSRRDHNVRTEPQSDIGRNKRKKKPSRRDHF